MCQVAYHRLARTIAGADGLARQTLDSALHVSATDNAEFSHDGGVPFFESHLILELKYRVRLPGIFRRLVEEFALSTQTVSKYRLGMSVLRHAQPHVEHLVADTRVVHL